MTHGLVRKIKKLIEETKKVSDLNDAVAIEEVNKLERLVTEIEDFWSGKRVSRFRINQELRKVS